jgi:voltage-dependent potassium channel beta subunit
MEQPMEYRHLGRSGLRVSVLSLGSWVTFGDQLDVDGAADCMAAAYDAGVNFFDNAETYAGGDAERVMGAALRDLGWPRHRYVVTSKYFWGLHEGPNTRNTLNRKYLLESIGGSLERLGLDHLDIIYCHRPDPHTPVAETARAMSDAIERGWALYWGTSQWPADDIRAAWELAERHGWHPPIVEQPEYSLLARRRVERDYARLYEDIGLGTTVWSPLAQGVLTGKYLVGVPDDSRARLGEYGLLERRRRDPRVSEQVRSLVAMADEVGATAAQLAIAWCAANPRVSTVITGASRIEQLRENLGALDVLRTMTPELKQRLDALFEPVDRQGG